MLDRTFMWEMSQLRRHELLELAEVVRPARRSMPVRPLVRAARAGTRVMAQAWSHTLAAAFEAGRLDSGV